MTVVYPGSGPTVLVAEQGIPGKQGDPGVGVASLRSGVFAPGAFSGTPPRATVTFSSPMADALYSPVIGYESAVVVEFIFRWANRTTAGFEIVCSSDDLGGLSEVSWHVLPVA